MSGMKLWSSTIGPARFTPPLDQWDVRLIMLAKSDVGDSWPYARKLWAERCGMPVEDVRRMYVVSRLAKIVDEHALASIATMIDYTNPYRFYPALPKQDKPHDESWYAALMTVLLLARRDQFPPGTFNGAKHFERDPELAAQS
tara:strand:+ start:166 stop:594 length:429 start_codon:yes stop_codon:yes gene_type:complete